MVSGEVRVTLNLGNVAIPQVNQYSTPAMAGATVGLDYLFPSGFTHRQSPFLIPESMILRHRIVSLQV